MNKRTRSKPWKILSSKVVYQSPFIKVLEDRVITPEGERGIHNVVLGGKNNFGGVSVVPINERGEIYLVRQYRYAHGGFTFETINGGVAKGESPLVAARRELKEEANLLAKSWIGLGKTEPGTESLKERQYLYLAQDLTELRTPYHGENLMKVFRIPFEKAINLVRKGKIPLSESALNILLVWDYLQGKKEKFPMR